MDFRSVFPAAKPVIGMLHLPPLAGSPSSSLRFEEIREFALADAAVLVKAGIDGLLLENIGDAPFYPARVPAHTVAFMAVLAAQIRARFPAPLGVNVLRNDGVAALAVATAAGAQFIRVNVYTGARLTDQGILEGEAHRILRERRLLASSVLVFADVAVKHSAPLGPRDLAAEVEDTVHRGRADAIIVTGAATGKATALADLQRTRRAAGSTPVLAGSGVGPSNIAAILAVADGVIVGTALRRESLLTRPVDPARVRKLLEAARRAATAASGTSGTGPESRD